MLPDDDCFMDEDEQITVLPAQTTPVYHDADPKLEPCISLHELPMTLTEAERVTQLIL